MATKLPREWNAALASSTAARIAARYKSARDQGQLAADLSDDDLDVLAWASMGANVFLGLRFAVWDDGDQEQVAELMSRIWRQGFCK